LELEIVDSLLGATFQGITAAHVED